MTKFQKQMLTIAAAGALTAVTALPAMAFENEFHGLFNFNTVFSNTGVSGDFNPGINKVVASNPDPTVVWTNGRKMNNYMEQRMRLQYIAKASDDLKMVTHLEANTRWGNAKEGVAGGGGDLDTDGTGTIQLKHAYLDFNVGKSFNTKVGLQAYKDSIKGLLIDADMPLVLTTTKVGAYTLGLGFGRYADDYNQLASPNFASRLGDANKDFFLMDNTFALNKDTKLGLSYYFMADYASQGFNGTAFDATKTSTPYNHSADQALLLHTFGLNGQTKVGGINLSGFAAMQAGHQKQMVGAGANKASKQYHGWAANVAADMKLGIGKARTAFLFASGNNSSNDAHNKGWVSTGVNSYNESGMMLIARNTYNSPTMTNTYVRNNVTNIALLTMGYDAQLTDKFNLNTNVGFGWAPSSYDAPFDTSKGLTVNGAVAGRNSSDFMGTEINIEAGYQLYKNLKVMAQGGYMVLGGYYKNSTANTSYTDSATPENPYTMRLQARYSF
ncbi:MAG: hypothetical protein PHN92_12650 [Geobacter sp.]|nr:hypothetical protein [Geobacter sp.]